MIIRKYWKTFDMQETAGILDDSTLISLSRRCMNAIHHVNLNGSAYITDQALKALCFNNCRTLTVLKAINVPSLSYHTITTISRYLESVIETLEISCNSNCDDVDDYCQAFYLLGKKCTNLKNVTFKFEEEEILEGNEEEEEEEEEKDNGDPEGALIAFLNGSGGIEMEQFDELKEEEASEYSEADNKDNSKGSYWYPNSSTEKQTVPASLQGGENTQKGISLRSLKIIGDSFTFSDEGFEEFITESLIQHQSTLQHLHFESSELTLPQGGISAIFGVLSHLEHLSFVGCENLNDFTLTTTGKKKQPSEDGSNKSMINDELLEESEESSASSEASIQSKSDTEKKISTKTIFPYLSLVHLDLTNTPILTPEILSYLPKLFPSLKIVEFTNSGKGMRDSALTAFQQMSNLIQMDIGGWSKIRKLDEMCFVESGSDTETSDDKEEKTEKKELVRARKSLVKNLNLDFAHQLSPLSEGIRRSHYFSDLTSFSIVHHDVITSDFLLSLSEAAPNLDSLDLSMCDHLRKKHQCSKIISKMGLSKLILSGVDDIDDECIRHMLSSHKSSFSNKDEEKDKSSSSTASPTADTEDNSSLQFIQPTLLAQKLKVLNLSQCTSITDESIEWICLCCSPFGTYPYTAPNGISINPGNSSCGICELNLSDCCDITDDGIKWLYRLCLWHRDGTTGKELPSTLQILSLSNCENITDDGIRKMMHYPQSNQKMSIEMDEETEEEEPQQEEPQKKECAELASSSTHWLAPCEGANGLSTASNTSALHDASASSSLSTQSIASPSSSKTPSGQSPRGYLTCPICSIQKLDLSMTTNITQTSLMILNNHPIPNLDTLELTCCEGLEEQQTEQGDVDDQFEDEIDFELNEREKIWKKKEEEEKNEELAEIEKRKIERRQARKTEEAMMRTAQGQEEEEEEEEEDFHEVEDKNEEAHKNEIKSGNSNENCDQENDSKKDISNDSLNSSDMKTDGADKEFESKLLQRHFERIEKQKFHRNSRTEEIILRLLMKGVFIVREIKQDEQE